jgi:hypothetical protein
MEGGLLEVNVENKRITGVNLRKIKMNDNFQPSLD